MMGEGGNLSLLEQSGEPVSSKLQVYENEIVKFRVGSKLE